MTAPTEITACKAPPRRARDAAPLQSGTPAAMPGSSLQAEGAAPFELAPTLTDLTVYGSSEPTQPGTATVVTRPRRTDHLSVGEQMALIYRIAHRIQARVGGERESVSFSQLDDDRWTGCVLFSRILRGSEDHTPPLLMRPVMTRPGSQADVAAALLRKLRQLEAELVREQERRADALSFVRDDLVAALPPAHGELLGSKSTAARARPVSVSPGRVGLRTLSEGPSPLAVCTVSMGCLLGLVMIRALWIALMVEVGR